MMLTDGLLRVGINPKSLQHGEQRLACPNCDRGSKDTALSLKIDAAGATWFCHRCSLAGSVTGERISTYQPSAPIARKREPEAGFHNFAKSIWQSTLPITPECVAGIYLLTRNCRLPPYDSDLRWIPSLKHYSTGGTYPALVGLVTNAITCEPLGLHRTWLRADGSGKADVEPNRKQLCKPLTDGVIRIWANDAVEYGLGVGEGIESTLSLAHDFVPVWCCMNANHLKNFPILAGVESLTISVDHDRAGIDAARACKSRWKTAGRRVHTILSKTPGHDLNDVEVTE